MPVVKTPIAPFSNPARLAKLDGRTMEARFLKQTKADILNYLHGIGITELNYEQQQILDRICYVKLHIHLADIKAMQTPMSDIAARTYIGFVGAIPRLMAKLRGQVHGASDADEGGDLHEYIARVERQDVAG